VNVVTLIGNLATDVDLREVGDGKKVASFLLAIDRPTTNEADFVRITVWERQAETCAAYLSKGRRVAVDGRLRSSSWDAPTGEKRRAVEVVANRVDFLDPPATPATPDATPGEVMPFERAATGS
jgi:single-strand DNA-binding protein